MKAQAKCPLSELTNLLSQHSVDHTLKLRRTQREVAMNATTNSKEVVVLKLLRLSSPLLPNFYPRHTPRTNAPSPVPHAVSLFFGPAAL